MGRFVVAFERSAGAMLVTSLTTSIAFGANTVSWLPPVAAFGTFMAVNVVVQYLVAITFLPAVAVACHSTVWCWEKDPEAACNEDAHAGVEMHQLNDCEDEDGDDDVTMQHQEEEEEAVVAVEEAGEEGSRRGEDPETSEMMPATSPGHVIMRTAPSSAVPHWSTTTSSTSSTICDEFYIERFLALRVAPTLLHHSRSILASLAVIMLGTLVFLLATLQIAPGSPDILPPDSNIQR